MTIIINGVDIEAKIRGLEEENAKLRVMLEAAGAGAALHLALPKAEPRVWDQIEDVPPLTTVADGGNVCWKWHERELWVKYAMSDVWERHDDAYNPNEYGPFTRV